MSESTHLTVIFSNDMLTRCLGEPVQHRRVTVALTNLQRELLKPRNIGVERGHDVYEDVSMCFLENTP